MKLVKFKSDNILPQYDISIHRMELCFMISAISTYLSSHDVVLDTERKILDELLAKLRTYRDLPS